MSGNAQTPIRAQSSYAHWLLQLSHNILLISGISSVAHLSENLRAADPVLSTEAVARLDCIGVG